MKLPMAFGPGAVFPGAGGFLLPALPGLAGFWDSWLGREVSCGGIPDGEGFGDEHQIELVMGGVADKEFGQGGEAFEDEGLLDEHADGLGDMGGALPGPVEGLQGDMRRMVLEGGGEVRGAAAAVAGVRVP